MHTSLNTKRIFIFIAVAVGIPWIAALVIFLSPMMKTSPLQAEGLANTIFISFPWLGNLAARLLTREGWGGLMLRPNFRRGWPFYLAVWLLPLLAAGVGAAVFYLIFPQSFDPNLSEFRKLVATSSTAAALNPWMLLLATMLSIMTISTLINTVVSMGEELGWRGYLLQKLVAYFSRAQTDSTAAPARKAALLTGLIHGVWHWPLLLMSASFFPGITIFTLLAYLVFTSAMSVLLSWATLRSGSVWPASLGHGVVNATSALPGFLLKGAAIPLLGPDPTGLLGGIGYIIIALVLLFNRKAFAGEKEVLPQEAPAVS